jgi:hypothetical protein
MKFYVYRLMLKATVIGRTAGLRCDSTCPPQPLCHGRPWLASSAGPPFAWYLPSCQPARDYDQKHPGPLKFSLELTCSIILSSKRAAVSREM